MQESGSNPQSMLNDIADHSKKQRSVNNDCPSQEDIKMEERETKFSVYGVSKIVKLEIYTLNGKNHGDQTRRVLIWRGLLDEENQRAVVHSLIVEHPEKTETSPLETSEETQPDAKLKEPPEKFVSLTRIDEADESLQAIARTAIETLLHCEGFKPGFAFNPNNIVPIGYQQQGAMSEHVDGDETNYNYGASAFVCNISIGAKTKFKVSTWPKKNIQTNVELNSGDVMAFDGSFLWHQIIVTNEDIPGWLSEGPYIRYSVQLRDMEFVKNRDPTYPDPL